MTCSVNRNKKGEILEVLTPEGNKSDLFEQVHTNIFAGTAEESLQIVSTYHVKMHDAVTKAGVDKHPSGELKLSYKGANGKVYSDIEELVLEQEPTDITAGFQNKSTNDFTPLFKMKPTKSKTGLFLIDMLKEGVLAAKKVFKQGQTFFQGEGQFTTTKYAMAVLAKDRALEHLASGNTIIFSDGRVQLDIPHRKVLLETYEGTFEMIEADDIPKHLKRAKNAAELDVLHQKLQTVAPSKTNREPVLKKLYAFLESMGFTATSIESYRQRYKSIHGSDPDVMAISDMANKIVAFKNNEIGIDELSEEVAHIALELYADQESIVEALMEVGNTQEYQEFAEYYRTKYAPAFQDRTEQELEDQVRREILGKILAKKLENRFQESENDVTGLNSILRGIWEKITSFFRSNLTKAHERILDRINNEIIDSIFTGDNVVFDKNATSERVFYLAMSKEHQKIHDNLKSAAKILEGVFTDNAERQGNMASLDKIEMALTQASLVESSNTVVGITKRKLDEVRRAIAKNKGEILDLNIEGIAMTIQLKVMPLLDNIKSSIKEIQRDNDITDPVLKRKFEADIQTIMDSIDEISDGLRNDVSPMLDKNQAEAAQRAFDKNYDKDTMSPEAYEEVKEQFKGNGLKDYGKLMSLFSILSEKANPILQMIALRTSQIYSNVRVKTLPFINSLANQHSDKNWAQLEDKILERDANGKPTNYIISAKNRGKADQEEKNAMIAAIVSLGKFDEAKVKAGLKKGMGYEDFLETEEEVDAFNLARDLFREENQHRAMLPEYYKQREKQYEDRKTSKASQQALRNFTNRRSAITQPHSVNGRVDQSQLSEEDKDALNSIKREQGIASSPVTVNGDMKVGLKVKKVSELTARERAQIENDFNYSPTGEGEIVILDGTMDIESLPEESRLALDMNNLTNGFIFGEQAVKTISDDFIAELEKLEEQVANGEISKQTLIDWVMDNSDASLSQEYYDEAFQSDGYLDNIEKYKEYLEQTGNFLRLQKVEANLQAYQKLTREYRQLMKQNKMRGNTLQTDAYNMNPATRKRIRDLEKEINNSRKKINLPKEFRGDPAIAQVTELSPQFERMAIEAGLNYPGGIKKFALRHMNEKAAKNVNEFESALDELLDGIKEYMNKSFTEFFEQLEQDGIVNDSMNADDILKIATDEYAKSQVAGYFKMRMPLEMKQNMDQLGEDLKFSDFFKDKETFKQNNPGLRFLELRPSYSWMDTQGENLADPGYKANSYYKQYRTDKYLNEEFFTLFGISKQEYYDLQDEDLTKLTPTRNLDVWDMYVQILKAKDIILEKRGETNTTDKFLRPQFARVLSAGMWKEFATNRKDEKAYGEMMAGAETSAGATPASRVIPKYGKDLLEDPSEVTRSTVSAIMQEYYHAVLYEERVKGEKDLRALHNQIKKQNFTTFGASKKASTKTKPGETSTDFAQAAEHINHHIYGVRQTRPMHISVGGVEIDLTKVLTKVQKFSVFSNLAYHYLVDLTGATTGNINNAMDTMVGEYFHSSANKKGREDARLLSGKYLQEVGNMKRTSYLGHMYELLGLKESEERTKLSKEGKAARLAKDSAFLGSDISNVSVSARPMMSAVNDYRVYNGKFLTYFEYIALRRNQNPEIEKSQISDEWVTLDENSFKNLTTQTDEGIRPNDKFKEIFGEESEEAFLDAVAIIGTKVKTIVMRSDSVINKDDQIAGQRDVLTNLALQHTGWLIVALTRKFKKGSYNLKTNTYEEGHYRSFLRMLREVTKGTLQNKGGIVKAYQDYYAKTNATQKQNIRRTIMEAGVLGSLLFIFEFMDGDDEEDIKIPPFFELLALRTISEYSSSSTLLGVQRGLEEKIANPIASLRMLRVLASPLEFIDKMNEYDGKGRNKAAEMILKNSPARRIRQYLDLEEQLTAYKYYNDPTLFNLGSVESKEDKERAKSESSINNFMLR